MQLLASREPCAVLAELHRGRAAEAREPPREFTVVAATRIRKQRANFVLVCKNQIEPDRDLLEQPVAGAAHDLERREIERDGALCAPRRLQNRVSKRAIEDDVAFDVNMARARE